MRKFQGMLFDFNGVLFLDFHLQEKAWHDAIAQLNLSVSFLQHEINNLVHGRNNQDIFETLFQRTLSDAELKRFVELKEGRYRQLCLSEGNGFKLTEGAIELFEFLIRNHVPFTIATASGKKNLDFFIHYLFLDRWFAISKIMYDDGTLPGKPYPDIYQKAASILDLLPWECVVLEDSWAGVQSAKAAKIGKVIGFGENSKHSRLRDAGADLVIASFRQFPRYFFERGVRCPYFSGHEI